MADISDADKAKSRASVGRKNKWPLEPFLNPTAELESQLANDSSTLITANSNVTLSVLQLKALLNIPADQPLMLRFHVERYRLESLAELDPAYVYSLALNAAAKDQRFQLQAAMKNVSAKKATLSCLIVWWIKQFLFNTQKILPRSYQCFPIGQYSGGTLYSDHSEQQPFPLAQSQNTYFKQK